nr:YqgE/AlgH family protein [Rhabdothermincola salaria]
MLVATPVIGDPNFDRTVVLLLDHGDDGALGLVLNRPTDVDVGGSLPQWAPLASDPAVVFVGGPVEQAAAIGLGRPAPGSHDPGDRPWSPIPLATDGPGPLATLDLGADPGPDPRLEEVRVFVGYSGWGAGQLEAELDQEAWLVVPALGADLWSDRPDDLWRIVLRRQQGSTAWLSLYPSDPSGN